MEESYLEAGDQAMLSMTDGRTQRKAEIPPYKHAITAYGSTIADLPSQIAYGSWQKNRHSTSCVWV